MSARVSANASEPAQRSVARRRKQAAPGTRAPRGTAPQRAAQGTAPEPVADDLREQVWTLHLRGLSMRQIALRLDLNRKAVARLLGECERAFGAERRARLKRKLERAIAGLRHVQAQAWEDHDSDDAAEKSEKSAHLRLALDAEREIARLEGLYASDTPDLVAVLFRVERVERTERVTSGGVVVTSARIVAEDGARDEADGGVGDVVRDEMGDEMGDGDDA